MKPAEFTARVDAIVARAEGPAIQHWEDIADKRIKIQFRAGFTDETRRIMHRNGFRFVGGHSQYWVRRLDKFGREAARKALEALKEQTTP